MQTNTRKSTRLETELSVGTEVYMKSKTLSRKAEGIAGKLVSPRKGPYFIDKFTSSIMAIIRDQINKIMGTYKLSDLKEPRRSNRHV